MVLTLKEKMLLGVAAAVAWIWTLTLWFQNDDVRLIDFGVRGAWKDAWAFLVPNSGQGFLQLYRPLSHALLLGVSAIVGAEAWAYHLVSLCLNSAAVVLVAVLLTRCRSRPVGMVAAALFALHPIHVLSVAWISGQTDLLATVAGLGAIALGLKKRWWWATLVFGCALLSKEIAATVLVLTPLLAWTRSRTQNVAFEWREIARGMIPQLVLFAVWSSVQWTISPIAGRGDTSNILSSIGGLLRIPGYLILPGWYDRLWAIESHAGVALGIAAVAVTVWGVVIAWRKSGLEPIVASATWVIVAASPIIVLDLLTGEPPRRWYLFLPSVGICWVWAEMIVASKGWRRWTLSSALGVAAVSGLFSQATDMWQASSLARRSAVTLVRSVDQSEEGESVVLLGMVARLGWLPVASTNPAAIYRLAGGTKNLGLRAPVTLDVDEGNSGVGLAVRAESGQMEMSPSGGATIFRPAAYDFPNPFGFPIVANVDSPGDSSRLTINLSQLSSSQRNARWLRWNGIDWETVNVKTQIDSALD